MSILLASGSPQRKAILTQLNLLFRVVVPDVVELEQGEPEAVALENSRRKAAAARDELRAGELLVAVDTIVVHDSRVFGKPDDAADAERMLRMLRGRMHTVVGGLTVVHEGERHSRIARTDVRFRTFSDAELERYLARDEWQGRAGGYAIQGTGAALVDSIHGDYLNVVGFPVAAFLEMLEELGLRESLAGFTP